MQMISKCRNTLRNKILKNTLKHSEIQRRRLNTILKFVYIIFKAFFAEFNHTEKSNKKTD